MLLRAVRCPKLRLLRLNPIHATVANSTIILSTTISSETIRKEPSPSCHLPISSLETCKLSSIYISHLTVGEYGICKNVTRLTVITDNSSRWVSKNSILRDSPNVWLLVYDPVIPAQEAYETGTAGLTLMNANGFTTITLTPNYMRRRDSTPHYESDAQVNTSPMLDVVCDVATRTMSSSAKANDQTVNKTTLESNAYAPCNAPIAFRFANLERQTATERPAMQWGDIVMNVGSYFALVQFVCWVFSGLAWSGAI